MGVRVAVGTTPEVMVGVGVGGVPLTVGVFVGGVLLTVGVFVGGVPLTVGKGVTVPLGVRLRVGVGEM